MKSFFGKILVGFDNSPSALLAIKKALEAARRFDSEVYAVYVNDNKDDILKIKTEIEALSKSYDREIVFIEKSGKIHQKINEVESEIGADLIVLGAHGSSGWQPFWIGSNVFRVVSASNCPVITIPETTKDTLLQDILVPLDSSLETRQKLPYAIELARKYDAKIHVLLASKDDSNSSIKKLRAYGRQTIDFLAKNNIPYTIEERIGGSVAKQCIKYVKEIRAGLLLMMTETESTGLFMGTYAQELINQSPIPVMAIHSRDVRLSGSSGY